MSAESNSQCPVCRTAEVVCGKWTLLLIRDLAEGSSRFCELIEVKPGSPVTFIYGENEVRYTIKVQKLELVVTGHG